MDKNGTNEALLNDMLKVLGIKVEKVEEEPVLPSILLMLNETLENLKYLGRWSKNDFLTVLFPNSVGDYGENKWILWQSNPLHFLFSCSSDKLEIIEELIVYFKNGGQ